MQEKYGFYFLILFILLIVGGPTLATPPPDDDVVTEDSLNYRSGFYVLDNIEHQPYPFGSFAIFVDREGIGHIQSNAIKFIDGNSPPKQKKPFKGSIIPDWTDRTSFKKKGKGWTQLSLTEAKTLWGEPRTHKVKGKQFYTFDAESTFNGERNLYHLDFQFGTDELIIAYRIRGIGIRDPQWVTAEWKPKS